MNQKKRALRFIVILGIVSLFADMTYEGARSIIGPYLSLFGASAVAVGAIIGFGDLIGYGFRLITGYLSDKTKSYWTITFIGYVLNLISVPLLALTNNWKTAAFLIILERFGKAIRVPARDTMLSFASAQTGRGWGFGLHEALDQIGAVIGPLLVAAILFISGNYKFAFATLSIPAFFSLTSLIIARLSFRTPCEMEEENPSPHLTGLTKPYWFYVIGVSFVTLGFVNFPLMAYHFQKMEIFSPVLIAFFYALAMGVDGISALITGKFFDIKGFYSLAIITAATSLFAPLVYLGGFYHALIGIILWGIAFGAHESIMRAAIGVLTPPHLRGSAYGIMNFIFGGSWAIGSVLIGILYDINPIYVVVFSMGAQLIAVPFFLALRLKRRE
jgi:MFS family permease